MRETKMFEIRDRATLIPALAIRVAGGPDDPLLWRAGFGYDIPLVILVYLTKMEAQWDPYSWPGLARTMREAHRHIQQHWFNLSDGEVVDVEYILGETKEPKKSDVGR